MRAVLLALIISFSYPHDAHAQGYAGVIAEDPDQPPAAAAQQPATQQPQAPGYDGVIPGEAPAATGITPRQPMIRNGQDLRAQAAMTSAMKANTFKPGAIEWYGTGERARDKKGMLPVESSMEYLINSYMKLINNPKLTPEKRRENAQLVYRQLQKYQSAFETKVNIPVSIYQQLGAPEAYIADEKKSNANALLMIRKAMETVKPLI